MAHSKAPSEEIERRILSVMRRGMRLSCVAWLAPSPSGSLVVRFMEGHPPKDSIREGCLAGDLGAAAPVLSTGTPLLLNPDRVMPVRVPYAATPVLLCGAMASPVGGGLVWADRHDAPILEDEFAVFRDLCSVLEEETGFHQTVSMLDERADYLSRVLEGFQTILNTTSERTCMGSLVECASRMTHSKAGAIALLGCSTRERAVGEWNNPVEATIVAAYGDGTQTWLGRVFDSNQGLAGVALRSGASVPSSRRFSSSMGHVLGPDVRVKISEGESLIVHSLGRQDDPLGILVLIGGEYDSALATYGIRSLCDAGTLLVQRFRLQERISQDAMIDGLTGLYNRRAFLRHLAGTLSLCRRHGHALSLLMIDADHFKQVNDSHGHLAGDAALRFIAEVIRRSLRESDFAGRYGGEEFVIALPQTSEAGAIQVAERIRVSCSASPFPLGNHKIIITVSVGVASTEQAPVGAEGLIAAADMAMYAAKRAGRNRVVVAERLTETIRPFAGKNA